MIPLRAVWGSLSILLHSRYRNGYGEAIMISKEQHDKLEFVAIKLFVATDITMDVCNQGCWAAPDDVKGVAIMLLDLMEHVTPVLHELAGKEE
jgi:hypothetical protein